MKDIDIKTVLDYDLIELIREFSSARGFMTNSCMDYLDSLVIDGDKFGVVIFVEPCGDIVKWGNSWEECIKWWTKVFKSQPKDWDYCKAGYHLLSLFEQDKLPDKAQGIWKI